MTVLAPNELKPKKAVKKQPARARDRPTPDDEMRGRMKGEGAARKATAADEAPRTPERK